MEVNLQVVESYTIGRDQFGMEKEFIVEVVQNCPNPACRYYKNQLEMTQKSIQQHLSQQPTYIPGKICLIILSCFISYHKVNTVFYSIYFFGNFFPIFLKS